MQTTEALETRGAGSSVDERAKEYLTFRLSDEEYAIDILKVQEIRGYEKPTRIANAPHYVLGVVNLRGVIIPIIDLRLRSGGMEADYTATTVVIILNVGSRVAGVVVDSVSDVLELSPDQISDAPDLDSGFDTSFILGLGTVEQRMLILIDIEKMMGQGDLSAMDS